MIICTVQTMGCKPPTATPVPQSSNEDEIKVLAEPSFESTRLGSSSSLWTVRELTCFSEIDHFVVSGQTNTGGEDAIPTEETIGPLLANSAPVPPDSPLFGQWHYAPWCHVAFRSNGREWHVSLLLGGLGFITDDSGRTGAFRYGLVGRNSEPSDPRETSAQSVLKSKSTPRSP